MQPAETLSVQIHVLHSFNRLLDDSFVSLTHLLTMSAASDCCCCIFGLKRHLGDFDILCKGV
jgi:hypothetical protein